MGADIHFFTERWTSDNKYEGPKDLSEDRDSKLEEILENCEPNYRWVSADTWSKDDSWHADEMYNGRSYYLFAILADVRNGSGGIEPIDYPRGIPDDASSGYKYAVDRWDGDGHSHSYFTLDELINFDWSKYEMLGEFMETIEQMKSIDPDPKNVRCCFFFDN
jgi:hypothetical protein